MLSRSLRSFAANPLVAMDFFARQDNARRKTGLLLFYFSMAVVVTIILVYLLPVLAWFFYQSNYGPRDLRPQLTWWHPELFALVCGATLIVVLCGAFYKIAALRRGGGEGVATMLGGKQIYPDTDDYFEKRLRNVVEEMAIASGLPVPPVYVMERENGINAFAAGFTPSDSVIAVTYGTMTGLTRDELQGVIAHEFSHILNNDTQMNVTLMGIIHGLLIIGLTGRIILEFAARGSRSRSKDSGQVVVFAIAAGLILWIVGSCGMLFSKLIKAAISRSRERLADASAVQFTRNPDGLANALKKIGGLSYGSRIRSPNAEQASHMFFGNGLGASIFCTHPPLAERVQWLEPAFDGEFPTVTLDDLHEQLTRFENAPKPKKEKKPDVVDLFTDPTKLAVTGAILDTVAQPQLRPNNPEALIASVGAPMEQHAEAARQLIDSIPERVKEHARDPYGARMLIYFLLLDSNKKVRDKQMAVIESQAAPEVFQTLTKAIPDIGTIKPEMRLPIIDLAIPALRFLSKDQYVTFRTIVINLIGADQQVDVFEYALQLVLIHHLDPVFSSKPRRRVVNYYSIKGLVNETSVVLSVLARIGNEDDAEEAFRAATAQIAAPGASFQFLEAGQCTWEALDAALDKLNEGSFKVKKWVLGATLACLMHDGEITVEETELFRAIANTLDCPVPPWVTPMDRDVQHKAS